MDRNEIWETIYTLSEIRSQYDIFNSTAEQKRYHACSVAIKALRHMLGGKYESNPKLHEAG